jgi:hypothetical protein
MDDQKISLLNGVDIADLDNDYITVISNKTNQIKKISLRALLTSPDVLGTLRANEDALASHIAQQSAEDDERDASIAALTP